MEKPLIALSLLDNLRCCNCQKFVTCGPVHVIPKPVPQVSILCGRCHYLAKSIYQNKALEAIADMFKYPCCHWESHCPASLEWNSSLEHEDGCSYRGGCSKFWSHPGLLFCSSNRELPLGGDIRLVTVTDRILEHLTCVLCQQYLSCEPVYLQSNGKNVCHRCVNSNGIPRNCIRNQTYELLCSKLIVFPCMFRNWGCPTRHKFGRDMWQHETVCSYNYTYKKSTPESRRTSQRNNKPKEKGVIQTHSGHYYGTITPLNVPFAPPTEKAEFDVNKILMNSMRKREERRFNRAEDMEHQWDRMTGDTDSEGSYKNGSFDRVSASGDSRSDEFDRIPRVQSVSRDSGYSTPNRQPVGNNVPPAQMNNVSRSNSFQYPTTAVGTHDPRINRPRRSLLKKGGSTPSPEPYFVPIDEAGDYRNFTNLARSESSNSNKDFLMELKIKQGQFRQKNALWEAPDS